LHHKLFHFLSFAIQKYIVEGNEDFEKIEKLKDSLIILYFLFALLIFVIVFNVYIVSTFLPNVTPFIIYFVAIAPLFFIYILNVRHKIKKMSLGLKPTVTSNKETSVIKNKPSRAWYLLLMLGFVGGILGYLVLKNDDRKMARKMLIFGIVVQVLEIFIPAGILFFILFYT